jgi:hypothetical protein
MRHHSSRCWKLPSSKPSGRTIALNDGRGLASESPPVALLRKPGKIAYSGYDGPDSEIYTIKPGGGGKFNVTDNGTEDYSPSWETSK